MESAEHAWIGDQVRLTFESGEVDAKSTPLQAGPGRLTYGQCIALGGDFYGVVGGQISTAAKTRQAFEAAYHSLTTAWGEVGPILSIMAEEIAAVNQAVKDRTEPSVVYHRLGDTLSMRWNRATGGGSAVSDLVPMGRYLALAAENWDHFADYAVTAYRVGHTVAMDQAAEANNPEHSPPERRARLEQAYAMNAFADHFLTDLFSAGHLRAPRKQLYEQIMTPVPGYSGSLGSLLVRAMHDEDCKNGLKVHNAAGETWRAYGDKRLLDSVSGDNRRIVVKATQASAKDVWLSYESGRPGGYSALQFTPDLVRVLDVRSKENFSPLFRMQDGITARRNDIEKLDDYSWTTDWWGWSTFAALYGKQDYRVAPCRDMATKKDVGWLSASNGNYLIMKTHKEEAALLTWSFEGEDLYLRKKSRVADRYLGLSDGNNAGWGVVGGWRHPVLYNKDYSISLKSDPKRRLCLDGEWVKWSVGDAAAGLLRVDLPLVAPSES